MQQENSPLVILKACATLEENNTRLQPKVPSMLSSAPRCLLPTLVCHCCHASVPCAPSSDQRMRSLPGYQCRLCVWCHGLMTGWVVGLRLLLLFFCGHLGQKSVLDAVVRSAAPYLVKIFFHTQDVGVRVHPLLTCFWCLLILFELKERSQISERNFYPQWNKNTKIPRLKTNSTAQHCYLSGFRLSPLQSVVSPTRSCSDWWLLPSECLPELGGKWKR